MISKAILPIALGVLLLPAVGLADPKKPPLSTPQERIVQDVKTKITYYLESDQLHLVAISQDGKILWVADSQVMRFWHITKFKVSNGILDVEGWNGQGQAIFDCKTGSMGPVEEL
jgi:hypothetical protein